MTFEKIIINLLPIAGIFLSVLYKHKAKGEISEWSGFRTELSTKSNEAWKTAHDYAAKFLLVYGICFLLLNIVIISINLININVMTIVVFLQLIVYILIGCRINDILKKKFDNN